MKATELYSIRDNSDVKKEKIIEYGKYLYNLYNRPLTKADFRDSRRISSETIRKQFGSMGDFLLDCGIPSERKNQSLDIKDFLLSIRTITSNGCWVQYHYNNKEEYPKIKYQGKNERLHRVSFSVFTNQKITENKLVLHSCDNKQCYNPDHLSLGDHSKNALEAVASGLSTPVNYVRTVGTIKNPYNYSELLSFIKDNCIVTEKNEWLYTGSTSSTGYPMRTIKVKNYYLHRLVLANKLGKTYEEITVARHVLPDKSKPNKLDLNPDHLIEGSNKDNSIDCLSYSKSTKLTIEKVKEIRDDMKNWDFSVKGSKKEFDQKWAQIIGGDISSDTISKVRLNKSWSWETYSS